MFNDTSTSCQEATMSYFMQGAVTLGGCIAAFTLMVAVIEMFAG
jgi:hypothetical protein